MYIDGLNLRRTVPNCPQLTPFALFVVPTMFGYTVDYLHTGGLPVCHQLMVQSSELQVTQFIHKAFLTAL